MLKFVKSKYATINWNTIGLKGVKKGEIFAVTPEIEENGMFQDGVATKNLIEVTIGNAFEFEKVVNITDKIRIEFMESIKPKVEEVPIVEEPVIPVPETVTVTVDVPEEITIKEEEAIEEVLIQKIEDEIIEEVQPDNEESEFIVPDNLDKMNYPALQKYALEVEKFHKVEINRSATKVKLLAEVKAVLKIE